MSSIKPLSLSLQLGFAGEEVVGNEELDRITRQLMLEIQTLDVESIELPRDERIPEGAKPGEAVVLGTLLMEIVPVAIPALLGLIQAWVLRDHTRKVRVKTTVKGQPVELEYSGGISQRELETFRDLLMDQ